MTTDDPACVWALDCEGNWETSCEETFVLLAGTPSGNRMNYCAYCGRPLRDDIRPTLDSLEHEETRIRRELDDRGIAP